MRLSVTTWRITSFATVANLLSTSSVTTFTPGVDSRPFANQVSISARASFLTIPFPCSSPSMGVTSHAQGHSQKFRLCMDGR